MKITKDGSQSPFEEEETKFNTHMKIKRNCAFRINYICLFKLNTRITEVTEV